MKEGQHTIFKLGSKSEDIYSLMKTKSEDQNDVDIFVKESNVIFIIHKIN